jgi:hypothetical protein
MAEPKENRSFVFVYLREKSGNIIHGKKIASIELTFIFQLILQTLSPIPSGFLLVITLFKEYMREHFLTLTQLMKISVSLIFLES